VGLHTIPVLGRGSPTARKQGWSLFFFSGGLQGWRLGGGACCGMWGTHTAKYLITI